MADSKLFTTITIENMQQTLGPLRRAGNEFLIITAESGYCPACHSDLSSANITAPNSLLGHLRRSKKCIHKREERNIKLFGLKQPDSLLWASVDDIVALDAKQYPDREFWVSAVFPPTRPQMTAPLYTSVSQWQARSSGSSDGYISSSPSPSSSSDDGSSWNSSSSSGGSPTSGSFGGPPYIAGSDPNYHLSMAQYATRRESAATISPHNYYKQQAFEPQYVVGPGNPLAPQQYAKQAAGYAPAYNRAPGPYTAQLYQNNSYQQPSSYQQTQGYPQGW